MILLQIDTSSKLDYLYFTQTTYYKPIDPPDNQPSGGSRSPIYSKAMGFYLLKPLYWLAQSPGVIAALAGLLPPIIHAMDAPTAFAVITAPPW